jgi:hypothetical protein
VEKLSEKWFEQSFDRELAGIRTSDGAKTRSLGGPKDLAISALGTFQTDSKTNSRKFAAGFGGWHPALVLERVAPPGSG